MKNRFIILLLISTLLLRCVAVVHGTQMFIFARKIAVDPVLDDKLLPSRGGFFFVSIRMLKAQSSDSSCEYNEQTASNKYHSLRHPIPSSGMYMLSRPYFVFRVLSDDLISNKCNLLPVERVTPNNKGSPEITTTLPQTFLYFKNFKYATNDPYLYTSLSFTTPGHCFLALTQQSLHKRLPLFIAYDNALFSALKSSSAALRAVPVHTSGLVTFSYGFSLSLVLLETACKFLFEQIACSLIIRNYNSLFYSVLQLNGISNIITRGNHMHGPP